MILTLLSSFVTVLIAFYYLTTRKFNYWRNRNVPHLKPTPLFGNFGDYILIRRHLGYVVDDMCKKFPNEPYFGAFFGTEPAIVVKDPELLKLIMTKDFYYFNGREVSEHVHREKYLQTLFNIHGDNWKILRKNLNPVFTSAKMKKMFPLIERCSYQFENLIDEETKMAAAVDVRVLLSRFTMACIVSCAFGVDSETLGERYKDNPFTKSGDVLSTVTTAMALKVVFRCIWPNLFYTMGFQLLPSFLCKFIKLFIIQVFESRQHKPSNRHDFVDYLMTLRSNRHMVGKAMENLKTGGDKIVRLPLTDDVLISQVLVFLLAGFETSAKTALFTLLEMAKHPETQGKVLEEIDAYLKRNNNKLTFDLITELPYTYACIEETMRLYPILVNITREVYEDYTLPGGLLLEKGLRVQIPVYHLHRNPKYFQDPDVFRPERFLGEERKSIPSHAYMPFGEGPRICIGIRFAKMQMLAGLVTILKKYRLELDSSTPRVPIFEPQSLFPTPIKPMLFKMVLRDGWAGRQFHTSR